MKPHLLIRAYRHDCVWELWDLGGDDMAEVVLQ